MPSLGIDVPNDSKIQQIAAAIYAESASANWGGGESAEEKTAIGEVIANRSYYATLKQPNGKPCGNVNDFGDGTILKVISIGFASYNNDRWNDVMTNDKMDARTDLEGYLDQSKLDHLRLSIVAANDIDLTKLPIKHATAPNQQIFVAFQKSDQSPSPLRMELVGKIGVENFFKFKTGCECH